MLRKMRRMYWRLADDYGDLAYCAVIVAVLLLAVVIYGIWPR